ncbi:MAG: hypothetical protein HYV37_01035 [Candidatus Levyibacteriota bacterium]|nr:MAG: hypothetical protein HYV37_01035 [Candidatus Levybacteria bacterium]
MWWKIFFWINIVFAVLAILGLAVTKNSFWDVFSIANFIVVVVGLYAFIYRKKVFSETFWLFMFWFNIVTDIVYTFYVFAPNDPIMKNFSFLVSGEIPNKFLIIAFSLLDIPLLYAIYQLTKPAGKVSKK